MKDGVDDPRTCALRRHWKTRGGHLPHVIVNIAYLLSILLLFSSLPTVALCCARWCQFKNRSLYRVHEKTSIARHRRIHGRHHGDTIMVRSDVCRWNTTVRRTMARALITFLNKRFVRLPRTSKAEEESAELARHKRVEPGAYYCNADRTDNVQRDKNDAAYYT